MGLDRVVFPLDGAGEHAGVEVVAPGLELASPDDHVATLAVPNLRGGLLPDRRVPPADQRGGSQVIRWGNMYISITHEVNLFKNYLKQKDAIYRHRLLLWDDQLNLIGLSKAFSFLDARVEFCVGAAVSKGDLLLSFGFQDNAAFVLRVPKLVVEDMILEALSYDN
jgi:hypothetical protein